MRRLCLLAISIFALGGGAPAHAQQVSAITFRANQQLIVQPARANDGRVVDNGNAGANPDAVVARLMTFDRNHDGLLTREELPERMQALVTRGDDAAKTDALDAAQIRRIALQPAASASANGLQIGHYGFGDGFNFDTRLHIDGALDDLRLARDVREKAGTIARDVQSTSAERAHAHLLATMEKLLTPEQFTDFKASVDGQFVTVHAIKHGDVLIFGATPQEAAGEQSVAVMLRTKGTDLSGTIAKYELTDTLQQKADAEIAQFNMQRNGRLSVIDGEAIVDALQGLLDGEQRGDLRAALERRPLVKQGSMNVVRVEGVQQLMNTLKLQSLTIDR